MYAAVGLHLELIEVYSRQKKHNDAYDITEWLAVQPWSDGNIGMFGRSYWGITQFMAASKAPPHLKAIFPEMSEFDHYSFIYPGGIFHDDFFRQWGNKVNRLEY